MGKGSGGLFDTGFFPFVEGGGGGFFRDPPPGEFFFGMGWACFPDLKQMYERRRSKSRKVSVLCSFVEKYLVMNRKRG